MADEVKAWWEETATYFQADLDLPVGVNWMGLGHGDLTLLDDVDGMDVLELGCGGGQCSVALAGRGASLTAIDVSTEQLSHARVLAEEYDADVTFLQGDVTDLGMLTGESYDIAFSAYVFQWVEDLAACFAETYRVLRPSGRFVFSMPHPVYDLVDPGSHRIEDSYFDVGRQVTEHDDVELDEVTYRHTVSGVHNTLLDAGFTIDRMLEPGTDDPDDYDAGPWGLYTPELMSKLPTTLLFDARKE